MKGAISTNYLNFCWGVGSWMFNYFMNLSYGLNFGSNCSGGVIVCVEKTFDRKYCDGLFVVKLYYFCWLSFWMLFLEAFCKEWFIMGFIIAKLLL